MTTIQKEDFINSIASGFRFISYYHPVDFLNAMVKAYEKEESLPAKNSLAQILINSKMAAMGKRPVCQDTGMGIVFLKIGMNISWDTDMPIEDMVNEGIRQAFTDDLNPLRASMISIPIGKRENTGDNTPGIVHVQMVAGDKVDIYLAAKGFGSENKAGLLMLNPNDDIVSAVTAHVEKIGAGWCPPGVLGIGIGGSAEKAMIMAKESLFDNIDIHFLKEKGPGNEIERLRLELYEKINALGIGAQGLGGLTTVLDVKIKTYPTHAAALPVGIIPNCAANRHIHFQLDGMGEVDLTPPRLSDWPDIAIDQKTEMLKVNLDRIYKEDIRSWKAGDTLYISGKILTGRDAAHNRLAQYLAQGKSLPAGLDFKNRFIYYVGPVPAVGNEVIGPAGPTTAGRMDKYTDMMLSEMGVLGMIGKGERGPETIEAIKRYGGVYLVAVGGAAYLISKSIKSARLVAFEDLGMEAIYEFVVEEMPVIVGVDSSGNSIHHSGPANWRNKFSMDV